MFTDRLNQAITRSPWQKRLVAVLFLDLDHFNRINETLGHNGGDLLLQAVAKRLNGYLREGDSVARRGGDEFAILRADVAEAQDVPKVVSKILRVFSKPLPLEAQRLFITASIGISLHLNDGDDAETLIRPCTVPRNRAGIITNSTCTR